MNRKERVLAAIEQREVDRVPFSFWFHYDGERAQGDACVRAHLDMVRDSGVDFVKIMSDGFGATDAYDVTRASDWAKLRPRGRDSRYFQGQLERARRIVDGLRGECCAFYNLFAPFSLMRQQAGDDLVMAHLREDEAATRAGLDVIAQDVATLAEALVGEAGVTGVYLALQGGEKGRFTPDEYARIVAPSDLRVLHAARAHGGRNIAHLCGWAGDPNHLEVWRDYPADVFNWAVFIEGVSIPDGRDLFGGKTVLGGFDNRRGGLLYRDGTREQVQAFARGLVRDYAARFGDARGYIVGADCTLPGDVDVERLRWVGEALEESACRQSPE